MSLATGSRFGPYEILAPLGAGGMGEVYRARDTRLNRDVAIKVLPEGFAADPDRRARFEREAQAIAALSHPNILAIFDTGTHERQLYVVTELLEGETLRERVHGGAVPVKKAIDIAVQIARGLAAAHEKGIVHRDLKPENVFLLEDGRVKILDFGLARQVAAGTGVTETVTAVTDPGTVMGTVGYMAPEQVRGQAIDARADLFALGAVLYEMLSGRRAFSGDTTADTMFAIVKEDPPDLAATRADVSPALDRILRHCLEKNPAERFQSARDVAFALEALSGTHTPSGAVAAAAARRPAWRRPAALVLLVLAAIAAGFAIGRRLTPTRPPVTFETKTWDSEWITNARFAPGGQIVFSAALEGNAPELFVIRPGTIAAQPLGQPRTHLLSVSSNGELAVITQARNVGHRLFEGQLAIMTIDGAPLSRYDHVREADWAPDGVALAVVHVVNGSDQIEYPYGTVLHRAGGGYLSDLRVSPDGARVAFFEHQLPGDDRGYVDVADGPGRVRRLAGEYWGEEGLAWSSDGRSVFFSAAGPASEGLEPLVVNVSGTPEVRQALPSAGAMIVHDVAADGRLLVIREQQRASLRAMVPGSAGERELSWLDFSYNGFLSADGRFVVFDDESRSAGTDYAVRLRDISGSKNSRLGAGDTLGWSPDGRWAAAIVPSTEQIVLYATGVGEPRRISRGPIEHYQLGNVRLQWFPDGRRILFCGNERGRPPRCYEQDTDVATALPRAITPENVLSALLAVDGRTLLVQTTSDSTELLTIGGGPSHPANGFRPGDVPLCWTADGRAVVVQSGFEIPARLERVNPLTGDRTVIKDLAPPDRTGLTRVHVSQWIDDGRGYVYDYDRTLSQLFVATGVERR